MSETNFEFEIDDPVLGQEHIDKARLLQELIDNNADQDSIFLARLDLEATRLVIASTLEPQDYEVSPIVDMPEVESTSTAGGNSETHANDGDADVPTTTAMEQSSPKSDLASAQGAETTTRIHKDYESANDAARALAETRKIKERYDTQGLPLRNTRGQSEMPDYRTLIGLALNEEIMVEDIPKPISDAERRAASLAFQDLANKKIEESSTMTAIFHKAQIALLKIV